MDKAGSKNASLTYEKIMKKLITVAVVLLVGACVSAHAADAQENWTKSCAKCHSADGTGQNKMGQKLGIKDLTDAKVQAALTDDAAFKAIKEGVKDKEDKVVMKPAEGLTDDEIKALVQHVRSFKK